MYSKEQEIKLFESSKDFIQSECVPAQIDQLRSVIKYHEWKYGVQNNPVISDYEFDTLYKKLEKLEQLYPELITPDSPTQRVTSDLSSDFPPVTHLTPMLSLDNSYNGDDLRKFDTQIRKLAQITDDRDIEYCLEPKFDGGSVAIVYSNDQLLRAATRGNGAQGDDITLNVKTLASVPLSAAFSKSGIHTAELRGEAVIRKSNFEFINQKRAAQGLSLFANPRNSAAGGLRMKRPQETKERGIEVFLFQLGYAIDQDGNDVLNKISTHGQQINLLKELGFKLEDPKELICKNIEEVITKIKKWENKREGYPYEIDGMVVKVNERSIQEKCGYTQHHPKWAIAFKFKAKQATTTLEDVAYQVGKIGSITPVAKVTPTQLAGVTVSSISLHNEEFITSKDLRIGDKIIIERAGDVIPYIVKSLPELRSGNEVPLIFPKYCPINPNEEISLVKVEGEAAWRCNDCTCGAQDLQRLIFHVSKTAMDIDGFGKSYVERFYELGWVRDMSDIYNLNYDDIAQLEGFGKKSADKLKKAVNTAKENTLSRLLHSLSVHHLGKKASKLIAAEINNIYDLIDKTEEDLAAIKDIGPVVAQNVIAYFQEEKNIAVIRKMESYGVNVSQTEEDKPLEVADDAALKGKTILFTGSLQQMTRNEAKKLAESLGAKNVSSVSGNLDILVVGEKAGSKLKKAQALNTVQIMTEEEFITLANS